MGYLENVEYFLEDDLETQISVWTLVLYCNLQLGLRCFNRRALSGQSDVHLYHTC